MKVSSFRSSWIPLIGRARERARDFEKVRFRKANRDAIMRKRAKFRELNPLSYRGHGKVPEFPRLNAQLVCDGC